MNSSRTRPVVRRPNRRERRAGVAAMKRLQRQERRAKMTMQPGEQAPPADGVRLQDMT